MSKAKVIIILAAILLLTPIASGCAEGPPVILEDSFWLGPGDQPGEPIHGEEFYSDHWGCGCSAYGLYWSKLFFLESGKPVEIVVRQRIPESGVFCLDGVLLRGKSYSDAWENWDLGATRRVGSYREYLLVFIPPLSDYYCLVLLNECMEPDDTVECEFTIRQ